MFVSTIYPRLALSGMHPSYSLYVFVCVSIRMMCSCYESEYRVFLQEFRHYANDHLVINV
jgi:hypothetical protein